MTSDWENYPPADWMRGDPLTWLARLFPEWEYNYALRSTGSVFLPLYDEGRP